MGSHWREVIGKAKVVLGCSRKHLGKAAAKTGVIVSILSLVVSFASYKQSLERHIEDAEEKRIEDLEKQPSFAWDETLADSENHYIIRISPPVVISGMEKCCLIRCVRSAFLINRPGILGRFFGTDTAT